MNRSAWTGLCAAALSACVPAAYVVSEPPLVEAVVPADPVVEEVPYTYLPSEPPGASVGAVEEFYEPLSPYGTWTESPAYGWVFAPSQPDYVPYADGYWSNTDYGPTWVSD